ncbi:MAG: cytochrome P450, partial [Verrucomicrobiaceae bacterium]
MSQPPRRIAPGPPGHFFLGNLREFRSDVLSLVVNASATYGDVVRCRLGPKIVHLINHPDLISQVLQKRAANYDKQTRSSAAIRAISGDSLLTSNGTTWKLRRRMNQPAFHHHRIAGFAEKMTAETAAMLDRWKSQSTGATLDIASEMSRLTYSIVGRTLFSFDTGEDSAAVENAMRVMLPHVFARLGNIFNPPAWFPTAGNRRFTHALADVDRVVYRIIREHRRTCGTPEASDDL